jgi:hypothetical protein
MERKFVCSERVSSVTLAGADEPITFDVTGDVDILRFSGDGKWLEWYCSHDTENFYLIDRFNVRYIVDITYDGPGFDV